ncbi:MAG: hypothetical protein MZV65_38305 [Chromatiales bacterium]|nr:hypothetical protein [Chromatiales bacterium]
MDEADRPDRRAGRCAARSAPTPPSPPCSIPRWACPLPEAPRLGVIKFWGMGGLILAAPVFRPLRRASPAPRSTCSPSNPTAASSNSTGLADRLHLLELPPEPAAVGANIIRYFRQLPGPASTRSSTSNTFRVSPRS